MIICALSNVFKNRMKERNKSENEQKRRSKSDDDSRKRYVRIAIDALHIAIISDQCSCVRLCVCVYGRTSTTLIR